VGTAGEDVLRVPVRLLLVVLAAVAAFMLGALAVVAFRGADDDDLPTPAAATSTEASAAPILAAARNTLEQGSSRVYVEAAIGDRTLSGEGAYDYDEQLGEVHLDLGGLGGAFGVEELDLLLAGDEVYYQLPAGTLLGGEQWVKVDVEALRYAVGVDLEQLARAIQSDPGQYLRWLGAVGENVERVGTETVRGTEATHYRATVDLDEVLDTAAPEGRDATRALTDFLQRQLELGELPIDVWVDGDELVRRIRLAYDVSGTPTRITMELDDFGVEVDAPPAPDDVIDLGDLLGTL
jgi:hypothetical protein